MELQWTLWAGQKKRELLAFLNQSGWTMLFNEIKILSPLFIAMKKNHERPIILLCVILREIKQKLNVDFFRKCSYQFH